MGRSQAASRSSVRGCSLDPRFRGGDTVGPTSAASTVTGGSLGVTASALLVDHQRAAQEGASLAARVLCEVFALFVVNRNGSFVVNTNENTKFTKAAQSSQTVLTAYCGLSNGRKTGAGRLPEPSSGASRHLLPGGEGVPRRPRERRAAPRPLRRPLGRSRSQSGRSRRPRRCRRLTGRRDDRAPARLPGVP